MIARSSKPLAFLLAGPLADMVFEPLLAAEGPLVGNIGQIVGVGPGRGIGMLFIIMGLIKVSISLGAYFYPHIRLIETELPDILPDKATATTS